MKKFDLLLFITIITISLFGIIMIYSASYIWAEYKFNDPFKFVKHQGLFFIIGIIMMLITSKIPYKVYFEKANTLLLISIILLILVIIPGIGTVRNGSRSWFGIGSFGIQPSEFAKLTLIIFTSKYLTKNEKNLKYIKKGVLPILGIVILVFGLIMLQPDFGTGMIILVSIIGDFGSAPRGAGAHMLVNHSGRIYGTIGGGAVEYQSEKLAAEALQEGRSLIKAFSLDQNQVEDIGMICGGNVLVIFQYISANDDQGVEEICDEALAMLDKNEDAWMVCELLDDDSWKMGLYSESAGLIGIDADVDGKHQDHQNRSDGIAYLKFPSFIFCAF